MAARYGRAQTSALLDQPPNVDVYRRLYPADADEFDDEFTTATRLAHGERGRLAHRARCAWCRYAGQQQQNLVALVPEADVLFAGAMATFGVTPNCFDGDPLAWADALGDLGDLAGTIVPGIGPIGGTGRVGRAAGLPVRMRRGRGRSHGDPHRTVGRVDRSPLRRDQRRARAPMLARGDADVPPSMLRLVGLA